ncbi:hypothetical protein J2Z40_000012 [Cytobacillus eiseniae]|uniref:Uncharacterized protein n=1 Tax=Cytobacillus eiseniae TaxID=762947 RepID=A0ABS4RAW0_9BACI|nr:hypothetical protein [Cytobacillus eiseniae]MBP2239459.1 hypothetical protein [Cytobacillus eiseniae]
MNIQQFYKKTASLSLSVSLGALIPPFFLILFGIMIIQDGRIVLIALPFLLYSFFCYQYYLICDKRSTAITVNSFERKSDVTLLESEQVLIHFLPSLSFRMLLFGNYGQLLGEVKNMNKWSISGLLPSFINRKRYGLYNELNELIAIFHLKKNQIEIETKECTKIMIWEQKKSQTELIYQINGETLIVNRAKLFMDYQFHLEKQKIGRLQKGWMPVEWSSKFKDPNTPVLSFIQKDEQIKIMIVALLSKILH